MAHHHDPVIDKKGRTIGVVTSCAIDSDGFLTGQALVELKSAQEGTPVFIYQGASKIEMKAPGELAIGDRITMPAQALIISRFPN
jgi:glycine hydroxymethyltransferase